MANNILTNNASVKNSLIPYSSPDHQKILSPTGSNNRYIHQNISRTFQNTTCGCNNVSSILTNSNNQNSNIRCCNNTCRTNNNTLNDLSNCQSSGGQSNFNNNCTSSANNTNTNNSYQNFG